MKKVTLFAAIVMAIALALTMSASAEDIIDFTSLPPTSLCNLGSIYNGYHNMAWTGVDYLSVPIYENNCLAAGGYDQAAGMKTGPEAQIALIGGPACYDKSAEHEYPGYTVDDVCRGSIQATFNALFQAHYLIASEGWAQDGDQSVTVEAYIAGKKIGSQQFDLGTKAQKFQLVLPNAWGDVSELVLWPSPGGSVVLYVVSVN